MIGNSLWQLVINSDLVSIVILLILFLLSIFSWSVAFFQYCIIREKNRQLEQFADCLAKKEATFDYLLTHTNQLLQSSMDHVGAQFLGEQIQAFHHCCLVVGEEKIPLLKTKDYLISIIDTVLYDSIDRAVSEQNRVVAFFATIAGISPLLGLLGTVWGLIHAFLQISQTQVADLATVAPGISEALITTLAGLIVAIPALVFCNIINSYVGQFESLLEKVGMRYRVLFLTQLVKENNEKV
jgi:biopolymer transport protein TolQ